MHLLTTAIATIFLFIGNSIAIPLQPRDTIPPNQQSCTARSRGLVINYNAHIGVPFSQAQCDSARDLLLSRGGLPTEIHCFDDGTGMTWLKFNNLLGQSKLINGILDEVWGNIAANGGFNCPNS